MLFYVKTQNKFCSMQINFTNKIESKCANSVTLVYSLLYLLHLQHEDDIDELKEEIEKLKRQITDAVSNTSKHINSTLRYVTIRYHYTIRHYTYTIRYCTTYIPNTV